MNFNRRDFIKTGLAGASLTALAPFSGLGCSSKRSDTKAVLNLSFQEWTVDGDSLDAKLDYMESLGVVGLEPGGHNLENRVNEFEQALRNRNIRISAICAGFNGFILAEDKAVLQSFMDSMRSIIGAAGALGSTGVIMVPAFNGQVPVYPHTMDTRNYLVERLTELGEYALQQGTAIILEPLNRSEAFYLRQVSDAAAICRDSGCKGVTCMGDFWHMTFEEPSDRAAFLAAGDHLQHVHVASRKRRSMPGEDGEADNYIDGFKGLKELGYDKYVSFECGSQGDKAQTIPAAVRLLREQWEMA